MVRSICAVIAGFVLWWVAATVLNFGLRAGIPGYSAAEHALAFTLGMKIGRLMEGALSSLAAGATVSLIAPAKKSLPWVLGAIMLAMFIPIHVQLWARFPVWYHLTFLASLVLLVGLGGRLTRRERRLA